MQIGQNANSYKKTLLITIFLSAFLLSGMDRYSLKIAGGNFRIVFLIIPIIMILVLTKKVKVYRIKNSGLILLYFFLLFAMLTVFNSVDQIQSLLYWAWSFLTILFCYFVSFIGIELGVNKLIKSILVSGIVVSILTITIFLLGNIFHISFLESIGSNYKGIYRPALWFYEPSYLVTFLTFFFSFICFLSVFGRFSKKKMIMLVTILFGILTATSSTGYLGIIITLVIIFFWRIILRTRKKIIHILILVFLSIVFSLVCYYIFRGVFEVFLFRMFYDFSGSTGNRIENYSIALRAFLENPLLGVGLGAYESYTGSPPTNVILEIFSTNGLLAGSWIFLFFIYVPLKGIIMSTSKRIINNLYLFSISNSVLVTLIVMQANQNYLRPYIWLEYGLLLAIMHMSKEIKAQN